MIAARILQSCACLLLLAACDAKKEPEPSKPAAASASASSSAAAPAPAPSNPLTASGTDGPSLAGIMEKLDSEQKNRPNVQPNADKVFDTITGKLAIPLEGKKQIAAFTSGARYCVMATTKNDVYVVACEYADPESATKGVERTSVTNKAIKRREVLRKSSTTLAIQQAGESKAAESEAKRIHDAFVALQ